MILRFITIFKQRLHLCPPLLGFFLRYYFVQDPAGIFDLIEVVGNGTYGQVYKGTKINIFIQCGERGEMGGVISIFFQYFRNSRDESFVL